MKFSYNFLQSFFDKNLPEPQILREILTLHSFEVEDLQKIEIGKKTDFQFEIDILPNRTDCYSHIGLAREISAILGHKLKIPLTTQKKGKIKKIKNYVSLIVKTGCRRYSAKIILNPIIEDSPEWIKNRLEVCGLKSINNIVDITNYVMLELGQPLHAFDLEKIEGKKIIVRRAKKGEKILTLDDEEYELDKEVLVIADSKKPIAIAGIKGGKETAISSNTKIVLIESANFDPVLIRRASTKIDLKTDASLRFSHGLDPNLTEIALNRAISLISEICKGEEVEKILDFYPQKIRPLKIKLKKEKIESILGTNISENKVIKILKSLGFKTEKNLLVEVPTFRRDVSLPEDLIEEVGRILGYEKIKGKFPRVILIPPTKNLEVFWENRIKEILISLGFTECLNYSFCSTEDVEKFSLKSETIEIENPVSTNFQFLRPTLFPNLLKSISKNLPYFKDVKIFEIGKIFRNIEKEKSEKKQLAILLTGEKFFELKGIIDVLLQKIGISDFYYDSFKPTPESTKIFVWKKGKTAEIKIGQEEIGFLGELSTKILEKYEINQKITAAEIDLEKLTKIASEEVEYQPFSIYPAIVRDISVLVPKNVLVETVLNEIERSGGNLISDIDLFDIYEDENSEKKSLAFHIIFQLKDRAISSKEVDLIQEKIIENLEKNPNWEVRKK